MLHGKSPGSSQDPSMGQLKTNLEREGWIALLPDMPWSRLRYIDGNWDKAMGEVASHVAALRAQGATKVVVIGHSLGVPAAMSHAARGGDAQALVLLAPGHVPVSYYNIPQLKAVRESVDEARALVAAGKGDSTQRFTDINQGKQQNLVMTPNNFLSYFDPASDAEMSVTAPRVPATTPVMVVVGQEDSMFTRARGYFADKLPTNPKSAYVEVKGGHTATPRVANNEVIAFIKTALQP